MSRRQNVKRRTPPPTDFRRGPATYQTLASVSTCSLHLVIAQEIFALTNKDVARPAARQEPSLIASTTNVFAFRRGCS